jgi:hypothetical protein
MLRLEVVVNLDGSLEVGGAFGDSFVLSNEDLRAFSSRTTRSISPWRVQ